MITASKNLMYPRTPDPLASSWGSRITRHCRFTETGHDGERGSGTRLALGAGALQLKREHHQIVYTRYILLD